MQPSSNTEDKLLKEYVKHLVQQTSQRANLFHVTRVTLEGEHQYLLDLQQGYLSQANMTLRPVLDAPH